MLSLQIIRENPEEIVRRLAIKNFDGGEIIGQVITLDDKRKATQKLLDDNLARGNVITKEIGNLFTSGKKAEAEQLKGKMTELKAAARDLGQLLESTKAELEEILIRIPNLPHPSIPAGKSAEDNLIVHEEGKIPELPENALAHWDLATKYDIIDFALGTKITGAGFPTVKFTTFDVPPPGAGFVTETGYVPAVATSVLARASVCWVLLTKAGVRLEPL